MDEDEEVRLADLIFAKEENLPLLINNLKDEQDSLRIVSHMNQAIKYLAVIEDENVEKELFAYLVPSIQRIVKKLDIKTNALDSIGDVLKIIQEILKHFQSKETVFFHQIQSFMFSLGCILCSILKFCRDNRNVSENRTKIVDLFKQVQQVHENFYLELLNSLSYNISQIDKFSAFLEMLTEVGCVLSGMNIKSMSNTWKTFLNLSKKDSQLTNFRVALRNLNEQIKHNLELQKGETNVKIARFLIKILKTLTETHPNLIVNNANEITNFCTILFNHCDLYKVDCGPQFDVFTDCDTFISDICKDFNFLKLLVAADCNSAENQFGLLVFLNKIFACNAQNPEFPTCAILQHTFSVIANSFGALTASLNSKFYDQLIANIAISVLSHPNEYGNIEKILLANILQPNYWAAQIATDSWLVVLQNASIQSRRTTFELLLEKIHDLPIGNFVFRPELIYLKVFLNQLLKMLPESMVNEDVYLLKKNNRNIFWFFNIKQSDQVVVKNLLDEVYDTMVNLKSQKTVGNFVELMEKFNVLSNVVQFNSKLQINVDGFVAVFHRYVLNGIPSNNFHKLFHYFVAKFMKYLADDLTSHTLLILFRQLLKTNDALLRLTAIDLISRRQFSMSPKELARFTDSIADGFVNLVHDQNQIVRQLALDALRENWSEMCEKVCQKDRIARKLMMDWENKRINISKECVSALENAQLSHCCIEWTDGENLEPNPKKFKSGDETDELIDDFEEIGNKLLRMKVALNSEQSKKLKRVMNKFSGLLNYC